MKTATITLGGADYKIAPLKSLQVAEFLDSIPDPTEQESKTALWTRSLRHVALALANAKSPLMEGMDLSKDEDIDAAIAKVNDVAEWQEVDDAFIAVLDVSGLRKSAEGEAPATGSISSKSSVAS